MGGRLDDRTRTSQFNLLILESVMHPNPDISLRPKTHRSGQQERGRRPGVVRRLVQTVVRNWQRRRMIAALRAMDDNLLYDIGISRNDIPRVVDSFSDRELGMRPVSLEVERQSMQGNPSVSPSRA
ncbi:DUF1127 domain-containing protein [Nitratireductor mangrovi]|nr:DUF1127 domain-containing protein [Nitratireductor mangrovi]